VALPASIFGDCQEIDVSEFKKTTASIFDAFSKLELFLEILHKFRQILVENSWTVSP